MREFKFRAWDTVKNKMLVADYTDWDEAHILFNGELQFSQQSGYYQYNTVHNIDYMILMQFTGLRDKKGIDIYEDDVLFSNGCNYRLIRHISGAYELHEVGNDKVFFLYQENHNVEVIGNIHNNPEFINP